MDRRDRLDALGQPEPTRSPRPTPSAQPGRQPVGAAQQLGVGEHPPRSSSTAGWSGPPRGGLVQKLAEVASIHGRRPCPSSLDCIPQKARAFPRLVTMTGLVTRRRSPSAGPDRSPSVPPPGGAPWSDGVLHPGRAAGIWCVRDDAAASAEQPPVARRVGMVVPGGDLELRRVVLVEGVRQVEHGDGVVGRDAFSRATGSARTSGASALPDAGDDHQASGTPAERHSAASRPSVWS